MNLFDDFCKTNVQSTINRLLSLLDRDPFSKTYGCLDKSYHYLRTADFANSAAQMSALTLALIFNDPQVIGSNMVGKDHWGEWAKAAISYTWKLQKSDGSFDEWYPNERGWAGPTGYVLYTQIAAFRILSREFSEVQKQEHLEGIRKSAYFISRSTEVGDLANHYAIALLPLYMASDLLDDKILKVAYEELAEKFLGLVNTEGWSLEYDGVDISYNLATLSFLARIHKMNKDKRWLEYAQKSFQFLIYHFYPDGTFSGSISSRHTSHMYPYAIKYWAQYIDEAQCIYRSINENLWQPLVAVPADQDDHYVHYLLWDFLEALDIKSAHHNQLNISSIELPYQQDGIEKYFKESGIFIKSTPTRYLVANLKRGGAIKVFNKHKKQMIYENCGYVVKLKNRKLISNLMSQPEAKVQYVPSKEIECESQFGKIFEKRFSVGSFLLFRVFMFFAFNPKIACFLKGCIKKILIFQRSSESFILKRKISFTENDSILMTDELSADHKIYQRIEAIYQGGHFYSRYVPQSRYAKIQVPYYLTQANSDLLLNLRSSGVARYNIELM